MSCKGASELHLLTETANFSRVSEGVDVMPNSTVEHVSFSDGQINLRLNNGNEVRNVLSPLPSPPPPCGGGFP